MTAFYTMFAVITGAMMIASVILGCVSLLLGLMRMSNTDRAIPFIDLRIRDENMEEIISKEQTHRQFYMSITLMFFIWASLMAHTTMWLIS